MTLRVLEVRGLSHQVFLRVRIQGITQQLLVAGVVAPGLLYRSDHTHALLRLNILINLVLLRKLVLGLAPSQALPLEELGFRLFVLRIFIYLPEFFQ